MQVGIIALQGDVSEHVEALEKVLGEKASVVKIKRSGIVPTCQAIVLPGGESTTISQQLDYTGLAKEIEIAAGAGKPILATCAGLVLAATNIEGNSSAKPLGLMDITISRNIFGPQRESFETDLNVKGMNKPYRAVFIRAPGIVQASKDVDILAYVGNIAVAARQGNKLGLAFHPELTDDLRIHQIFMQMVQLAKEA